MYAKFIFFGDLFYLNIFIGIADITILFILIKFIINFRFNYKLF